MQLYHGQLKRAIKNSNYSAHAQSNWSLLATSLRKAQRGIHIGYAFKTKRPFKKGETIRL